MKKEGPAIQNSSLKKMKRKIKKMYANYGIDPEEMDEEALERICEFYLKNKTNLDKDYTKSEEHADKFGEDDII